MSGGLADELRVQGVIDHPGTVSVGTYSINRTNHSLFGLIPKEHARAMGVTEVDELECFVNYELGVVMHRIPEEADTDG